MRVLQLCQKPQRRGAELFAVRLAEALRARGHETSVAFLFRGPDPDLAPDAPVLGGSENGFLARALLLQPPLLLRLRALIRRIEPDVVQLNGASTVKYGAFSCSRSARPALVYRNIGRPQDWIRGASRRIFYRRMVLPRMDGIAAVSRSTLAEVEDFYGLSQPAPPAIPRAAIPTAVDSASLRPRKPRAEVRRETRTPLDAPVVIQVASLSREKRTDRLLSAFGAVRERHPDAHLWLLGDGPLRSTLEARVEAHPGTRSGAGLSGSVRFLGSREDVGTYLAAADVLALASDTEGLPAAVLEASCLGLPVVASRVGGLPECVLDGETGLLVESGDDAALGRALSDLLAHPELRQRLGEAGRRLVQERFTFDTVTDPFVELYQAAREHRNGHRRGARG